MYKLVKYWLIFFSACAFAQTPLRFAVIGDYGKSGPNELAVSNLVDSWNADFIITTGDNNYVYGGPYTIDSNIGFYYHEYIYPYVGIHGPGAAFNKFWPSLGNHDLDSLLGQAYYNYFTLPNNERYYDFIRGNVHFFALNSDPREADSINSNSVQAMWLQNKLAQSTSRFKIVYFHHPPYCSGIEHGSTPALQWPFKQWGATCVLSGHEHFYERLNVGNFTYFVNGLGGRSLYNFDSTIHPGSQLRYNADYGAQLVSAYADSINFKFYNKNGALIDSYTILYPLIGIIKTSDKVPVKFTLSQNYPNPFNPVTKIKFDVPLNTMVKLSVFDSTGEEIAVILNEHLSEGTYEASWDAAGLASGTYFYKLIAKDFSETKKMILIK